MDSGILDNFKEIIIEKPADKIIRQIKELISSGQLNPGDRLPSERMLTEKFGVGRTYVREAIRKLEFYGILKTLPQSGTVVAGIGIDALEGLITDILKLEGVDFKSLVETRVILETYSVRMAAERRTKEDIEALYKALEAYEIKTKREEPSVEEDLLFHLKITEASKNTVMKSLMLVVAPDIMTYFTQKDICAGDRPMKALDEHYEILKHIEKQDPDLAEKAMMEHLSDIVNYINTPAQS